MNKYNKYLMLEAAISMIDSMIMFNKEADTERLKEIKEGLKEFRQPEHTTLDKIIARQAAAYKSEPQQ